MPPLSVVTSSIATGLPWEGERRGLLRRTNVRACVRTCVRACVRAGGQAGVEVACKWQPCNSRGVRACVRACVRARVCYRGACACVVGAARTCERSALCRLVWHQLRVPGPVHDVEQGKGGGENLAREGVNPLCVHAPLLFRLSLTIAPVSTVF